MKKLLVILVVLAFVAPIMVAPAMAADNFSIKGSYYVSGWGSENFSNFDDNNDSDKLSFWTQRMRIQPQIKVADGVTANLRFDFAEEDWGSSSTQAYRPGLTVSDTGTIGSGGANEIIQVDRAYVDITKSIVNIKAGLQFFGVGQNQVFRDNQPGFLITVKTPVYFGVGYIKRSEDGRSDEEDLGTEDVTRYVGKVGYKADTFSIDAFYVVQKDDTAAEDDPSVFGVYAKSKVGPVDVHGELAMFGGDKADGTDYVGTQLNVEGIMKLNDTLSLGVELIYSDGTDKADEQKVAYIGNAFARKSLITGGGLFGDYYDANWKPSTGTPLGTYDVFDPWGDGAGATGGGIGAKYQPIEDLSVTAYFHYLSASEDIAGAYDSAIVYQAVVSYMLAPKTMLQAAYLAVAPDFKDNADGTTPPEDTATSMWLNLTVNF